MDRYISHGGRPETGATVSQLLEASLIVKTVAEHYHTNPMDIISTRRHRLSEAKGVVIYIFHIRLGWASTTIQKLLYKPKNYIGSGSALHWVHRVESTPSLHYQTVQVQRKLDVAPPPLSVPGVYEFAMRWLHCERF